VRTDRTAQTIASLARGPVMPVGETATGNLPSHRKLCHRCCRTSHRQWFEGCKSVQVATPFQVDQGQVVSQLHILPLRTQTKVSMATSPSCTVAVPIMACKRAICYVA
jgi:hypothetical protein